jgi:hypothetical protein
MITAQNILCKLREEYDFSLKSRVTKKYCEVFLNPSLTEIQRHIEGGFVRFLIPHNDPDSVYVWDADSALHDEVVDFLYTRGLKTKFFSDTYTKNASVLSRIRAVQASLKTD